MKDRAKFSWKKRILSFKYAWKGFVSLVTYEHNSLIHIFFSLAAIACCIIFNVALWEWCVVLLCIGLVIATEALNSAIEALADRIDSNFDPLIGRAKDLGAFAVLFFAIVSVAVGLIIFLPKFINLFS